MHAAYVPVHPTCSPCPQPATPCPCTNVPCTQVAIFHDFLTPSHIAQLRGDVSEAERAAGVGTHHGAHHGTHHGAHHGASHGASLGGGGAGLRFVPIDNETFSLPPSLARLRAQIPRSIRGYGMGYRHMCRFLSAVRVRGNPNPSPSPNPNPNPNPNP